MKTIYLLSGLGADERVFDSLDLSACKVNYIRWIAPLNNESISDYAQRLCNQIYTQQPILIGVSFGGIVAIEIAKHIAVEKVIQISSVKTRSHLPRYYRIIGQLRLNQLLPASLYKNVNILTCWFFGAVSSEDKALLMAIIHDTDSLFLKWAIHQIATWNQITPLPQVIQIHGTRDRLLPCRRPDFIIKDGGHLMIVNRATEINTLLNKLIDQSNDCSPPHLPHL